MCHQKHCDVSSMSFCSVRVIVLVVNVSVCTSNSYYKTRRKPCSPSLLLGLDWSWCVLSGSVVVFSWGSCVFSVISVSETLSPFRSHRSAAVPPVSLSWLLLSDVPPLCSHRFISLLQPVLDSSFAVSFLRAVCAEARVFTGAFGMWYWHLFLSKLFNTDRNEIF